MGIQGDETLSGPRVGLVLGECFLIRIGLWCLPAAVSQCGAVRVKGRGVGHLEEQHHVPPVIPAQTLVWGKKGQAGAGDPQHGGSGRLDVRTLPALSQRCWH